MNEVSILQARVDTLSAGLRDAWRRINNLEAKVSKRKRKS